MSDQLPKSENPGRSTRSLALLAALLPFLPLAPLLLGFHYGPVLPLDSPHPYYYLDLLSVLAISASIVVAIPGAIAAYRWRGAWTSLGLIAWLVALSTVAYYGGLWIT
jgi:hypothetical protein